MVKDIESNLQLASSPVSRFVTEQFETLARLPFLIWELSGGGLHEITSQVRNGTLRIDNPPASFNLSVNIPTPNRGADIGLVYRQCFAPITNLYYVVKDPDDMGKGADFLFAKSGKYAAAP